MSKPVEKQESGFISGILDTFRSDSSKPPKPNKNIGAPGTTVYGGYLDENEINAKLTGRTKYKTYSDILANTTIVAAGVRYFLNLVAKAQWTVEPADNSAQALIFAERLESIINGMQTPWHRAVRRAAMYRFYGFSIQEWTSFKNDEGYIGFVDIKPRPQITIEKWDVDETGEVLGVIQRSPRTQEELYLPRWKIVYIVDDTLNDSPEGLGLLRHLVDSVSRLKRFEQLEGFGFETDLRGIPVARMPFAELQQAVTDGRLTPAQKLQEEEPLRQFIKNHIKNPQLGLILDSITYQSIGDTETPTQVKQWDIELLKAESGSQDDVANAIERLNQEVARLLGVEGLLLGSTNHGSQALSNDKSHNFALIVDSTLMELAKSLEKDVIDNIWLLNGWPENMKPTFKTEATQYRDITQITTALKDLATAGAILALDDPAIDEVRDLIGLSKQPELNNLELESTLNRNRVNLEEALNNQNEGDTDDK